MSSQQFDIKLLMQAVGFDQAQTAMDKLTTTTNKFVQSQTTVSDGVTRTDKALKASKLTLTSLVSSFGTVTSSAWNLYNSWDSLEKVQLASQRANTKLKSSTEAVDQAQKKLNIAIAKYGPESAQAKDAADKLAIAQDRLTDAQSKAEIAAGDVTEAFAQFYSSLPTLVSGIVGSVASFASLTKEMGGLKGMIPSLISAVSALGSAFRFLFTTPIGIIITGIATAFTLLATNAFGVRDAVNAAGKALGDALPFLKGFLDTIGNAGNWFLNLINPIEDTNKGLGELGTATGDAGGAMETMESQVMGLNGELVNTSNVVKDVAAAYTTLRTQAEETNMAYQQFVNDQLTGNNKVGESYNLTSKDISQFKERLEKDMEDAKKASEEAAKASFEAWKKAREDINSEMQGGFDVIKSGVDKMQSDLASAAEEGGKEFKKTMKKYGLTRDSEVVYGAILKVFKDVNAEDEMTSFTEMVIQNLETLKGGSQTTFTNMVQSWVQVLSDEKPKFATEAQKMGDDLLAAYDKALNKPGVNPTQAFLTAIGEVLDPTAAQDMATLFGTKLLDTTAETFNKDTKVETAATGLTSRFAENIRLGTATIPTTVGTELDKIPGVIDASATKANTASAEMTKGINAIFGTDLKQVPIATGTEIGKVPTTIDTIKPKAGTSTTALTTEINTKIGAGMDTVKKTMDTKVPLAIVTPLTNAKPKVTQAGTDLASTFSKIGTDLWNALSGAWTAAANAVGGAGQALSDWLFGKKTTAPAGPTTTMTTPTPGKTDYTAEKNALTEFQKFVSQQTTTISAHFVTMKTSITGTMSQIQTFLGAFVSGALSTISKAVATQTTTVSAHFLTMKTSIAGTITQVQASVSQLSTGIATQASTISKHTTSISGSFLAMSQSVSSSMNTVKSASSNMSSTIASHMSSMSSHVKGFASSFGSAMSSVSSQASKAASAVKQLQSAVNALKSKSITVHVGLSGPGAAYMQHGGSFIPGLNPRAHPGGQHGFSGMVNTPTTFKGVRMGESFKPELVTVTPLTRGTGNHSGPTVSSSSMGGNTAPVINVTVVLDGRVIQRFVEKTALAGIGVQI